jgi:thiol-disulfide isomerase/thioredoxin
MRQSFLGRSLLAVVFLVTVTLSTRAELMVGDKAARLQTGKWIQGEPVTGFDSNHVYIVEFWATWCGPCVQTIPHLNQLWTKFKDRGVIVIGVDIWDSDETVAPFVKKMGTNMTYRVALDDKSQDPGGFMSSTWWKRKVNNHGIPAAFVINRDGVIAWIGHPGGLNEEILEEIISGKQDLAKAAVDYKNDLELDDKLQKLQKTLFASIEAKQWADAQVALQGIDTLLPRMTNGFVTARLQVSLGQKKFEEAYRIAESAGKRYPDDDEWLNEVAWTIAENNVADTNCLSLAATLAGRAVELTKGTNSAELDTLARVQFLQGKTATAIATQEKAVNVEQQKSQKSALNATLTSYREGKLPKAED